MTTQGVGSFKDFAYTDNIKQDKKVLTLFKQLDLQTEIFEKLTLIVSASKSLSVHQFKQISTNESYFNKPALNDFTQPLFDEMSFFFIKVMTKPHEFDQYIARFSKIFNEYFNGPQLNRHLYNLLKYFGTMKLDNKKREEVLKLQFSLLSFNSLMEASKYCEGINPTNFNNQFLLSLEIANLFEDIVDENSWEVKFMHASEKMREKWSEVIEVFTGDIKNFIAADELISSESPTSIFEAQGTVMNTSTKYQTAAFMAFAASTVIGPAGLSLLALPLVSSIARKVYLRWMRTAPLALPPLTDYSKKDKYSYSNTFIGRDEIIEKTLQIWKQNKHPILVGLPGVGKTAIIMEIGRRIAMGQLPGFENKTLFAGSAASITGENMMGPPAFQRIIKTLQPYREEVILALDEAHSLAVGKNSLTLLRSATDNSRESLRYCLFATTPDGYEDAFEKDESLRRRIVKIDIPSLEKAELLYLVSQEAKLISPLLRIEEKALEILYEQTRGDQNETRQLIHRILGLAESKNSGYSLIREKDSKAAEVKLFSSYYRDPNKTLKDETNYAEKIQKAREELAALNKECEQEKEKRHLHIKLLEQLSMNKEKRLFYSKEIGKALAIYVGKDASDQDKIQGLNHPSFLKKFEQKIKDLLILQFFEIPYQLAYLRNFENRSGLISFISEENIETLTKESKAKLSMESSKMFSIETSKGPIGLKNLGNSCYLNATLQILFSIPSMLQLINQGTSDLAKIIYAVYQSKNHSTNQQKALEKLINYIFDQKGTSILHGSKEDPHDAQELLQYILNELNWHPIQMNTLIEVGRDKSESDLIQSIAENMLSIAIPDQVESFEQILWKNFEKVQIIADGKKILPFRGKYQTWSQSLQIKEATPYIMVHLKRFDDNLKKIVSSITFSDNGIIRVPIGKEKYEYEIVGFINHLGNSLNTLGAHYAADIKISDKDKKAEYWFCCNDQEVKEISYPENAGKNAYIVLLKQK